MKIRNLHLIIFSIYFLTLSACDETKKPLSKEFVIKTNGSNKNTLALDKLKIRLDSFTIANTKTLNNSFDTIQALEIVGGTKVSLMKAVADIFDPEKHPCSLPDKIKKKLLNSKKDGKPWAPDFVNTHISKLPDSAIRLSRQSISHVLHLITIKKIGSNASYPWLVSTAPTYNNFNIENFILSGMSSFFYSLDCSGFLNAAIEGSATVPGSDIRSTAKAALETQRSIFIGGGVLISPLSAAYYANIPIDTLTRIQILSSILETPGIADDDLIIMNLSFDAIWASKNGSSGFNGSAELKSNAGAGIGIAQLSASSSGGGSLSRKSSFSDYDTYIVGEPPLTHPNSISIAQIKTLLSNLKK